MEHGPASPPKPAALACVKIARIGAELQACLTALAPVIVTEAGQVVKPLAIGLGDQIVALAKDGETKNVQRLLRAYCSRTVYRRATALIGSKRHDLNGAPVEPVSDEHRGQMQALLAREASINKIKAGKLVDIVGFETSLDLDDIVSKIVDGRAIPQGRLSNTATHFIVDVDGAPIAVTYSKTQKKILSAKRPMPKLPGRLSHAELRSIERFGEPLDKAAIRAQIDSGEAICVASNADGSKIYEVNINGKPRRVAIAGGTIATVLRVPKPKVQGKQRRRHGRQKEKGRARKLRLPRDDDGMLSF